jgi:integrase
VILDDIFETTITASKIRRNVKIPKAGRDKPVAFTTQEMRLFLDSLSSEKKLQFMVLKDTAMRIQEFCKLRKNEVNITGERIEITILANDTKTSQERICYITKETEPSFLRLYRGKKDGELMFGTNEDPEYSKGAYESAFASIRKKLAKTHPEFGEKYPSNGRHKKTIHSIRKFASTQCAIAIDKSWGHAYIGHDEYLAQYVVDPEDQFLKNFIRSENHLMVYERIEVVNSDERVEKLEQQQQESSKHMRMLDDVLSQISDMRVDNVINDNKIEQIKLQLKKK